MRILVFDGDEKNGQVLYDILKSVSPLDETRIFKDRKELMDFAHGHIFHLVFLFPDRDPEKTAGLGAALSRVIPGVNLVFVCEDEGFCMEAIRLHASGYIKLPLGEENVREVLENLLYPVPRKLPVIEVDEAGNEVYINGVPAAFSYNRTKLLMVLLLKLKGATISSVSLRDRLWEEDKPAERTSSYLQNLRADLRKTLAGFGLEEAVKQRRGRMWLDSELFIYDD